MFRKTLIITALFFITVVGFAQSDSTSVSLDTTANHTAQSNTPLYRDVPKLDWLYQVAVLKAWRISVF